MYLRLSKRNPTADRGGIRFNNTFEVFSLKRRLENAGLKVSDLELFKKLCGLYHVGFSDREFIEALSHWDGQSVVSAIDELARLYYKGVHCFNVACVSQLKGGAIEMLLVNKLLKQNGEPAEGFVAWSVKGNVIQNIDQSIGHVVVSVDGAEELREADLLILQHATMQKLADAKNS